MAPKASSEWQLWDGQRYWFFGQFSGNLTWSCPFCGHVQYQQIRRKTWHLQCTECRRKFEWGITLRPVHPARQLKIAPRDLDIELAPMSVTRPMPDGPRAPVHRQLPARENDGGDVAQE